MWMFPFSLSIPKSRILVSPLQLQVAWGRGSTSPPLQPSSPTPTLTFPPQSLSANLSASGVGAWSPLPLTPILPPNTVGQPRSLCMGDETSGGEGGGGGLRGQAPPSPKGILYRNTEKVAIILACLTSHLLLWRLASFRAFSYSVYLHSRLSSFVPFTTALNFNMHLLLWPLVSLHAISYHAFLNSAHTPMALKEWRRREKKMQLLWDYVWKKGIF